MNIIVGLGNPGEKYNLTRHNIGYTAINTYAQSLNLQWQTNKKFKADICKDNDLILIKPLTFMNNSGQAVQAVLSYYKLLPKKLGLITKKNNDLTNELTIIHDDLDIDIGKYKIAFNSRSAGHNGVQSIINHLKTKNFRRIRIGVRTEMLKNIPTEKFVLQKFNSKEQIQINSLLDNVLKEL